MDIEKPLQNTSHQEPIISGFFTYQGKQTRLFIFQESLAFHNQCISVSTALNSDFIYEIIQEESTWKLTIQSTKSYEFYCDQDLGIWDAILIKLMKRRGFHSIFKGIKKIGKGNFASVYLSQKMRTKGLYAVKAFQKVSTYQTHNGKQGLDNQIQILRKINHQNVPALQGVYQSENSLYVVQEYIHGKNLGQILQNQKIIPLESRKKIVKDLLSVLSETEDKHIIHRDIKPENIMIEKNGSAKLVDFGLATDVRKSSYLYVRCGTPGYVAPQIISIRDTDNVKLNTISDVFSLGAVFYQMIYGKPLFDGESNSQVLTKNRKCLISIPAYNNNASYQEIALLRRMLDVFPETRISAATALKSQYFKQNREPLMEISNSSRSMLQSLPPLKSIAKTKKKYSCNNQN